MIKIASLTSRAFLHGLAAVAGFVAISAFAEVGPPTANAGPDVSYVAGTSGTVTFALDGTGSTHPTEPISRYVWTNSFPPIDGPDPQPTVTLPVGVHVINLVVYVTDPILGGDVASPVDSVTITVTAPQGGCPTITTQAMNKTVECDGLGDNAALMAWINSHGGAVATVPSGTITWSDNYQPSKFVYDCAGCAAGHVTVVFTATANGCSVSTCATFYVVDTTAPTLVWYVEGQPVNDSATYQLTKSSLPITVKVVPVDLCSGATLTKYTKSTLAGCASVNFCNQTYTITSATVGSSVRFVAKATDDCGNVTAKEWVTIQVVQNNNHCRGKGDDYHGNEDDDGHSHNGGSGGNDRSGCNPCARNKHR